MLERYSISAGIFVGIASYYVLGCVLWLAEASNGCGKITLFSLRVGFGVAVLLPKLVRVGSATSAVRRYMSFNHRGPDLNGAGRSI